MNNNNIYKYIFKSYDLFYATVKERINKSVYYLNKRYLESYKNS
jgi:hypothetical protein